MPLKYYHLGMLSVVRNDSGDRSDVQPGFSLISLPIEAYNRNTTLDIDSETLPMLASTRSHGRDFRIRRFEGVCPPPPSPLVYDRPFICHF